MSANEAVPQTAEACRRGSASPGYSVSLSRLRRGVDVVKTDSKLDSFATTFGLQGVYRTDDALQFTLPQAWAGTKSIGSGQFRTSRSAVSPNQAWP